MRVCLAAAAGALGTLALGTLALSTFALGACASRPARSVPAAPAPEAAPPAPEPAAAVRLARFAWAPAVRRVEVRTAVDVTGDPPAAGEAAEQVRTVVYLTDTLAAGSAAGAVRAAGTVDSVTVLASDRVRGGSAADPPLAPLPYQAASDARGVRVDPATGATVDLRCTAPTGATALAALAAVREALPRVPDGATPGARWRDTTVTARCAGPVLLIVQTASRYEAEPGAEGLLAVVRRSATTVRGHGAAGVRPVVVVGAGTAEMRYLLDPARGAIAGGTGDGRATLTVTVAGAARRYAQRTRTEVVVRESIVRESIAR